MSWKIIVDSGCDMRRLESLHNAYAFENVPLVLQVGERTFVDDESLNINAMMSEMYAYDGPSSSACPSPEAYASAMRGYDNVLVFTLTSQLSGSYNSAMLAKSMVEEENPDVLIHVFDSLTASSGISILAQKAGELIDQQLSFEQVVKSLTHYKQRTHLTFALSRVDNLVKNGRINKLVGTMVGLLNIRIVGQASTSGTLEPLHRSRGQKKAGLTIFNEMKKNGYKGGVVFLAHCFNPEFLGEVSKLILQEFPQAVLHQLETSALCSFYAEQGGLLIGYEGNVKN